MGVRRHRARPGGQFGDGWGIEIDHVDESSPSHVQVLAKMPDLYGPGFTAEMTYYETETGARVFAAGAFRSLDKSVSRT